jgi:hypothetical protein
MRAAETLDRDTIRLVLITCHTPYLGFFLHTTRACAASLAARGLVGETDGE